MINNKLKILVRGAGDLASGIIWFMNKAGFRVICLEIEKPTTIRRAVSFSEAIYNKTYNIEGVNCIFAHDIDEANIINDDGNVAILIDEYCNCLNYYKPDVLIDCIMAKKNLGTCIDMANLVIGVGPGFTAKVDCHYAIETMRGHNLGHIYADRSPLKNTGVPGLIAGHTKDRVIHSPSEGVLYSIKNISDIVKTDDDIAYILEENNNKVYIKATIDGVLRGIIRDKFNVYKGLKIADIDPRVSEKNNCFTISDKARNIAGSVLLIINQYYNKYFK